MQDKTIASVLRYMHREAMNAEDREAARLVCALMKRRGVKPTFRRRSEPKGSRAACVRFHTGRRMAGTSADYAERAKRYLKAELKRAGVGYAELARRLTEMGLPESEGSITVKINRGGFPAWFLIASLEAIGAQSLRLSD